MTKRSFNSIKKDGRTRKWIKWAVDCPGPGCIFIVKTKYFVYLRVKWRICASKAIYANLNTCNLGYLILPLKGTTFCLTLTHFCEIKYRPFGRYTPTTYWIWIRFGFGGVNCVSTTVANRYIPQALHELSIANPPNSDPIVDWVAETLRRELHVDFFQFGRVARSIFFLRSLI